MAVLLAGTPWKAARSAAARLHTAGRILNDQAVLRRGAQFGRSRAEAVRRWLAVAHLIAAVRHLPSTTPPVLFHAKQGGRGRQGDWVSAAPGAAQAKLTDKRGQRYPKT